MVVSSPATPPKTEGGRVWVHWLNFWVVLTLHFRFLNYQSDPPDGLSRDRSQELPWLQIMHEAIVSSSFCQLCLSMLSERAEYSFLPRIPKSQFPRSRPRFFFFFFFFFFLECFTVQEVKTEDAVKKTDKVHSVLMVSECCHACS